VLGVALVIVLAQAPDFDGSYKTGPASADAGDTITYTIVAVNSGDAVTGVVLADPIPNGAVYVPGSCTYRRPVGSAQACTPPPHLWQEDFAAGDRITTTFAVQVSAGSMSWPLENCAYLDWDGEQLERCTTTVVNPAFVLYLPVVMRAYPPLPDLRVVSLTVEPDTLHVGQPVTITLVVRNDGGTAAGPFWVDLYDNPDPPPTHANQPFDTLCSGAPEDCYGIAWYVTAGLAPGEDVVLTSLNGYLAPYSRWPGYFVQSGDHAIYGFADSWNDPVWYGAVLESNEGLDNRYGPVTATVLAGNLPAKWKRWHTPLPQRPNQP